MDRILMAAIGGACIVWGLLLREQAERDYWGNMKFLAEQGKNQRDYIPQLSAGRSTKKGGGNFAIGFGVLMIAGMMV